MSEKQRRRLVIINSVIEGHITLIEASEALSVCYRQSKRIKKAVLEKGDIGVIHGNSGKPSWNKIPQPKENKIVSLISDKYIDFNDTHCCEKLEEVEKIKISRETIRQLRRGNGIPPKRKRRPKKHHARRERKERFGVMLQWDGSAHRWFGEDHPPCCLIIAVDDATTKIVSGRFLEAESSYGYLVVLTQLIKKYGIPLSIYHDRHSIFVRNDDNWSLEEQMQGKQHPTQVGKVLEDLAIISIAANTPQAKGRVEKTFETLQDRLVAEMRLAGITDMLSANAWLPKRFIPDFNRRFGVKPKKKHSAFRSAKGLDLNKIICFSYEATVGNDNAVRIGGIIIDVPPGPSSRSYAKCKVEVRQLLDGSWRVYYKDTVIAKREKTEAIEPIRCRVKRDRYAKGTKNYTSIYMASKPQQAAVL